MTRLRWWIFVMVVGIVGGSVVASSAAAAETLEERVAALEQEVKDLKHQLAMAHEGREKTAPDKAPQAAATVTAGQDGFSLQSADRAFQLRIKGYLQADGRFFTDHQPASSTFLARRIRPIFEGTVGDQYGFLIAPEFGSGTTVLQDAYLEANWWPALRLRAGKFKSPLGVEQLQSDTELWFPERGLPSNLIPVRDLGAQLFGTLFGGTTSYAVGAFNGAPDASSTTDADSESDKEVVGRVFVQPFKARPGFWQRLGVGLSGSYGRENAATPSFKTPLGQQTFFSYQSGATANGRHVRVSPQASYYHGPFGLLAEYVRSAQVVTRSGVSSNLGNSAWQVAGAYVLTGEDASSSGVKALKPFSLKDHTWGAVEVAGRYGQLWIDKEVFPTLAAITSAAQQATTWTTGLNWYLTKNVKVALDYEHTGFRQGGAAGDRKSESVIVSRLQLAY